MRRGGILKRILSMLLAVVLLILNISFTASCSKDPDEGGKDDADDSITDLPEEDDDGQGGTVDKEPGYNESGIIIPPYKDYGRGTIDLDTFVLEYKRPDTDAICDAFDGVSAAIRENASPASEQIALIRALEGGYNDYMTMYTLAEIYSSKNTASEFWAEEYEYISSNSPRLIGAVEDLYVACAQSPHRTTFENEYFKADLSEYVDGGNYTDAALEYMSAEATYQSEYKALSPATVNISYPISETETIDGTYEQVLEKLAEKYGSGSSKYQQAAYLCASLYRAAYQKAQEDIYVELLKVRYLLAREMGYSSYTEFAYHEMGYEYTPDDMWKFIEGIGAQVLTAYNLLYVGELSGATPKWSTSTLINNSYSISASLGGEYGEIFAYMLQHGLYDVSGSADTRLNASFTAYIENNNSPFMFITSAGTLSDFSTVMHEFGHFIDAYANNGLPESIETAELCSQGFEFLALTKLKEYTSTQAYDQMVYSSMMGVLDTLMYQGLLSAFEHLAYQIPYESIDTEALNSALSEACELIFKNHLTFTLADVLQLHLFVAPMYVQSYCTSLLPAVEIYMSELTTQGAGLAAYAAIINRASDNFLESVDSAALTSPFKDGALEKLISGITAHLTPIIRKYI